MIQSVKSKTDLHYQWPKDYNAEIPPNLLNDLSTSETLKAFADNYIRRDLFYQKLLQPLSDSLANVYANLHNVNYLKPSTRFKILRALVNDYKATYPEDYKLAKQKLHQERGQKLGQLFADIIWQNVSDYSTILDVGYGDGIILSTIAKKLGLSKKQVFGLEISSKPPLEKLFTPLIYDGKTLPSNLPAPTLITMNNILHHFSTKTEILNLLKTLSQKLKQNGHMLIRDTVIVTPENIAQNRLKHQLLTIVARIFPVTMPFDIVYLDLNQWKALFKQVGLELTHYLPPPISKSDRSSVFILKKL
jgi:Methyltransferase domain